MIRYLYPDALLGKYIKHYFLLDFEFDAHTAVPLKVYPANPEQGLTFHVRGKVFAETPEVGIAGMHAKSVLYGQLTCRQNLQPSKEYVMLQVRFQPGAFHKLFRIPMTEFVNKNLDAELVFGAEFRLLNEEMANAKNIEDLVPIFERFLWQKIKQTKELIKPIDKIGQMIFMNPQSFNPKVFAHEACLSVSQFERVFLNQVGVSAKFYARICRFHRAYRMKEQQPDLDWFSIAISLGYADYQHLAKDFKQFSGVAPNSLIVESKQAPERVFGFADFLPLTVPIDGLVLSCHTKTSSNP
ncbi:MAG: helix-turn-helix domain-containing protein [Spirosomataceae bacterium]